MHEEPLWCTPAWPAALNAFAISTEARAAASSAWSEEMPWHALGVGTRTSRSSVSKIKKGGPASRASARSMRNLNEGAAAQFLWKKASLLWSTWIGNELQCSHLPPANARAACSYPNHSKQYSCESSSEMCHEQGGMHLLADSLNMIINFF